MDERVKKPQRTFSAGVRREASSLARRVVDMLQGRPVVRGITIDGPTSRDLDDALWLESEAAGGYRLDISITDVAALVTPTLSPALDAAACERSFTRYFAQGRDPMLPPVLSERQLSLLEGQLRPTVTLSVPFDARWQPGEPTLRRTMLTSARRFTYEQVDREISSASSELAPMLSQLFRLSQQLYSQRRSQGALALYDLMTGWATTEEGVLFKLPAEEQHQSHLIIQECMILANQTMARMLAERGIAALYRNHTVRSIAPARASLLAELENAVAHPEQISPERVRTTVQFALERARYAPTVSGHFGLNLPVYLHATSPLRRYADLINQRILVAILQPEEPLPYTRDDLEAIANHINTVEADIKQAKQAAFRRLYDDQLIDGMGQRESEEDVAKLFMEMDASQFHSLLRMAAEAQDLRPVLEQELARRLDAHLLGAHDLFAVVFRFPLRGEAWDQMRRLLLTWLQIHPYHAPSLLLMGQQSLGWSEPVWEMNDDRSYAGAFQSRAHVVRDGQRFTSSWHSAAQKALAKQFAGAELLAQLAGVELPPKASFTGENTQEASSPLACVSTDEARPSTIQAKTLPNFKGQLQEHAQVHGWEMPIYCEKERRGPPHAPTFFVEATITVDGHTYSAEAQRTPKIQAEQEAAGLLLQQLLALPESVTLHTNVHIQAVSALQERVQQHKISSAAYAYDRAGPAHDPLFTCHCTVTTLAGESISEYGEGSTKKAAAQAAALRVLSALTSKVNGD